MIQPTGKWMVMREEEKDIKYKVRRKNFFDSNRARVKGKQ